MGLICHYVPGNYRYIPGKSNYPRTQKQLSAQIKVPVCADKGSYLWGRSLYTSCF